MKKRKYIQTVDDLITALEKYVEDNGEYSRYDKISIKMDSANDSLSHLASVPSDDSLEDFCTLMCKRRVTEMQERPDMLKRFPEYIIPGEYLE